MKYKIHFTLYNRKMLTELEANSPVHAEKILRDKIKIDQITELPELYETPDNEVDRLKNIFGMK